MSKRQVYRAWMNLRRIKIRYLLLAALVFGIVAVFALRANNLKMIELRQAVYQADKDNGDVEGALRTLREHVHGHMNTNLAAGNNVRPPIQLQHTYERLVAARQAGAQSAGTNGDLYGQAQRYCEQAIPEGFSGSYRLSCIQSFVKQRGAGNDPLSEAVPKNLYQFDFVSPRWSPDLAGWSLLAAIASTLTALAIWLTRLLMRRLAR